FDREVEVNRVIGGERLPPPAEGRHPVTAPQVLRSQIENRLPRLANVLLDLLAHADEVALHRGRVRLDVRGNRIELEPDADEALEQRVVQLAAQSHALAEDECELPPDLAQPQLPDAPD